MRRVSVLVFLMLLGLNPALPGQAPTAAERRETLAWLAARRHDSGGYAADAAHGSPATLPATSAAVRAIRLFGGRIEGVAATETFIKSCVTPDGLAPRPAMPADVRTTAVGIMAYLELRPQTQLNVGQINLLLGGAVEALYARSRTFDDIRIAAAALEALGDRSADHAAQRRGWITQVEALRRPMGWFGKTGDEARETASAVVTLLRLGGRVDKPGDVVQLLRQQQHKTGGWGTTPTAAPDLESTYRVVRCFVMLDGRPDTAALAQFVRACRNADGGYGLQPGQRSNVSATYFAGSVLAWLENWGQ